MATVKRTASHGARRSNASKVTPLVGLAACRAPWNGQTGKRRVPWADLDQQARKRRYAQAIRGFANGIGSRAPGTFKQYAAEQRALDKATERTLPSASQSPRAKVMPPIFGSSARTEILVMLVVNGPLTVRELARRRASDSSSTFRAVSALIECGLIVKRQREGGRKYVALHRAFDGARELRDLLLTLGQEHPVSRVDQARARWGFPSERDPQPRTIEKKMFGSAIRSQILLLLAAIGEADEQQLARALTVRHNSIWSALKPLTRAKLVFSRQIGARRVLFLSNKYNGAQEFRRLLQRLVANIPAYQSKANMIAGLTRRWK